MSALGGHYAGGSLSGPAPRAPRQQGWTCSTLVLQFWI
jgi:hypothetical protein